MSLTKNKTSKVFSVLILMLVINISLVIAVPFKAPHVDQVLLPESAIDPQIRLIFSELMDKKSVKENLEITPQLKGHISWSGKTFVYTPVDNLDFNQEYKLTLSADTKSKNGTNFDEEWKDSFKTPAPSFFFISSKEESFGQIQKLSLNNKEAEDISPEGLIIKSYDYSPMHKLVVALAAKRSEFNENKDTIFKPYIIDPYTKEIQEIERLHKENYKYHHIKWAPFENKLIIARTKLLEIDSSLTLPSVAPEDTELVVYNLDFREISTIKNGNTLIYEFYPSPDGSKVIFIDEEGNLILHSLGDSVETLITKDFLEQYGFSEYGNYLMYTVTTNEEIWPIKNNLIIQNQIGEKESVLKNLEGSIDSPSFAANEESIAFTYYDESKHSDYKTHKTLAIYTRDTEKTEFIDDNSSVEETSFSPNSKNLSYVSLPLQAFHEYKETGWNDDNRELIGGNIKIYNLENGEIKELPQKGTNIQWIY